MNRIIKFRAWDGKKMVDHGVIHDTTFGDGYRMWDGENHEYLPIMQFTGLTDKNGKEIYEGDIVKYYDSTTMYLTAEVKWLHCGWSIQHDGMDGDDIELGSFELPGTSIEVIGNIYENPELLK